MYTRSIFNKNTPAWRAALSLLFIATLASANAYGQDNPDFEQGLKGWLATGKVNTTGTNAHKGNACAMVAPGGSVFQRLAVSQLAIVQFNAYVKSAEKGAAAQSFIRFYNERHQELMEYKSDPIDSLNYQQTGNYTEAPANATYLEVGIENDPSAKAAIYTDDFSINADVAPVSKHQPQIDLDRYMRPMWKTDTIFNETVLLYAKNGAAANGRLLYQPDHILSVKSFDGKSSFTEGKDYSVGQNVVERLQGSSMPYRADTSFDSKKDLAWFNTQSQWVVVTYTHHDRWSGPLPVYKGDLLPKTMAKLRRGKALKIVAYGMSITRGMDVSSYDTVPPYMPPYVDLFARQLRIAYHDPAIRLYNAGLPGAAVDWGAKYAEKYVSPLGPDLVIVDFGMNDFWRLTPEQFGDYVKTIIKKVKAASPNAEFLLLSNMKFDPEYVLDSDKNKTFYEGNLEGYSHVLRQMETSGISNLDMYSISQAIHNLKKAKDCIVNPLHPNDYMARWYAQGMAQLLIK
jgi:hypothetical protein